MAERPILFSAPMIRAILSGVKTQTRRIVRGDALALLMEGSGAPESRCQYGRPGDRLWVRETWTAVDRRGFGARSSRLVDDDDEIRFRADDGATPGEGGCWIPSIYLPRWASRLTLEVTAARIERLNDITEADAKAEGVSLSPSTFIAASRTPYRVGFVKLWDSINGDRAPWESNPFVWVVSFRRLA